MTDQNLKNDSTMEENWNEDLLTSQEPYEITYTEVSNELQSYKSLIPLCIIPAIVILLPYFILDKMSLRYVTIIGIISMIIMLAWLRYTVPKYNRIKEHNSEILKKNKIS